MYVKHIEKDIRCTQIIIEDANLLPLPKWEAVEYFSMCQGDINSFLHEPFLVITLVQG